MKSIYNYLLCASFAGLLGACASEAPFDGPQDKGNGSFAKTALNLNVHTDHVIKQTRAGKEVEIDKVSISFFDKNNQLKDFYPFGEMPDVVVLEEGDYYVSAVYTHDGSDEHRPAAWDYPFYQGKSENFTITPNKITSDIDPIQCVLENVMTSVQFDAGLREHMSEDSFVELKLNESSDTLKFTTYHEDAEHFGYFHIEGEHSLVATFHGEIDGAKVSEVKTVSDVSAGNHYRITFKLHNHDEGENSGSAAAEVSVDATVTTVDMDGNVSIADAEIGDEDLGDAERPNEDPNEPENPENPDEPTPIAGPTIAVSDGLALGDNEEVIPNEVGTGTVVEIEINSETGITEFKVVIDSDTLDADELDSVGLQPELDLINPGEFEAGLKDCGFPVKDQVDGQTHVSFSITDFIPMLGALGAGQHKFILKVTDANGQTVKTLTLVTK